MRSRPVLLVAGLLLIGGVAYAPVAIARQATARPVATDGYSSNERDFTVGRSVFLRSTKTKIGRIVAVDDRHAFPPGFHWWSRHRSPGKAILLRHTDGPRDWVPVDGLSRIYVVR